MFSEASLDDDELDLVVLLKQQGLTLILAVFAKDFHDSDEVLDLVITKVWFWSFERRNFDGDGVIWSVAKFSNL